jgi:hypothetical protein
MRITSICCAFAAILLGSDLHAADVYVSKTGNETNTGTASSPFLTVNKGISVLKPGDRLLISGGFYDEDVSLITPASPSSPVTVDGRGVAEIRRLTVKAPSHRVYNLTVTGLTNRFTAFVFLRRGAHDTVLSNLWIKGAMTANVDGISWESPTTKPFGSDAASDCLVVSNRITRICGAPALGIMGNNNRVVGNYLADMGQADFVRLWGISNIIQNNVFTNLFLVPGIGYHPDFIQTFGNNQFGSKGHLIDGNVIVAIDGGQICQMEGNLVPEIRDWTFSNNVFAHISLGASVSVAQTKWFNNVFYRCNPTGSHVLNIGPRSYTLENNWQAGTNVPTGARIFNNAFVECGDPSNDGKGWYYIDTNVVDVAADYNYVVGSNGLGKRENEFKQDIGGQGGWQYFRWWEDHGINGGIAGFFSMSQLNFRIGATSILNGRGTSLASVQKDFLGNPRGATPSIGAFEGVPRPRPPQGLTVVP